MASSQFFDMQPAFAKIPAINSKLAPTLRTIMISPFRINGTSTRRRADHTGGRRSQNA
jgi:hypothetical protein